MSTSTQHDTQTNEVIDDWQPRPEIAEAIRRISTIAESDDTAVISDREIEFENYGVRTTISVHPVGVQAIDGLRIAERIDIRTPLTSFDECSDAQLAHFNMFATTGAIVRDADGYDSVVSTLPIFEEDNVALEDLYTRLIAMAARVQLVGPVCAVFTSWGRAHEFAPDRVALPGWNQPSVWGLAEFEYAHERLQYNGIFATAGPAGLTAEFPWEEGAMTAGAGDCTSLLQIRADYPHPAAGNGLFCRLDLPTVFASEEEVLRCAAELNRREASAIDAPPFFGAWCSNGRLRTVSFVSFWPNLLYQPGTVANIAFWAAARSRFAKVVIGNSC